MIKTQQTQPWGDCSKPSPIKRFSEEKKQKTMEFIGARKGRPCDYVAKPFYEKIYHPSRRFNPETGSR